MSCLYNNLFTDLTSQTLENRNYMDFFNLLSPPLWLQNRQIMVTNVGTTVSKDMNLNWRGQANFLPSYFFDFTKIVVISQVVSTFAFVQGMIAILQGSCTQQQVRNRIYRLLSMRLRNAFSQRESIFLSPELPRRKCLSPLSSFDCESHCCSILHPDGHHLRTVLSDVSVSDCCGRGAC
jgi:hypothetical protein